MDNITREERDLLAGLCNAALLGAGILTPKTVGISGELLKGLSLLTRNQLTDDPFSTNLPGTLSKESDTDL